MKKFLPINILLSCLILLFLASCNDATNDDAFGTSILDTMSNEKIGHHTRAFVEIKQEKDLVSFTVIYNGDITKMSTDNNSSFKALLETYNLEMQKPFEIDEENKGIVLVPLIPLMDPIAVGKEISLIHEVLMVEVDNITKEQNDPS
jgi:hypothetical protein